MMKIKVFLLIAMLQLAQQAPVGRFSCFNIYCVYSKKIIIIMQEPCGTNWKNKLNF